MDPNKNSKAQNYRNYASALMIVDLILVIIVVKNDFRMGSSAETLIYTLLFWLVSTGMNVFWNKAIEDTESWTGARWAVQLAYPAAFAIFMFFLMK